MSLYNINFNSKIVEWLPPDKRQSKMVRWLQALASPIVYLAQKIFIDYKTGSSYTQWSAGTYSAGSLVTLQGVVYESLTDNNTDQPPSANWSVYSPSDVGTDTRVLLNAQKLVLEWALNERFLTTFRQPPNVSDIYITTNTPPFVSFVIGGIETNSSPIFGNDSTDVIINAYSSSYYFNYTINISTVALAAIDSDATKAKQIITTFVNKYNVIGISFDIQTY